MAPTHTDLKAKQRRLRERFNPALRLRTWRAISWIQSAEKAGGGPDEAAAFISYWIAFNAAYAQLSQWQQRSQEKELYRSYLNRIVRLDTKGVIRDAVWKQCFRRIETLLDNQFVYQPFWHHRHGEPGHEDWCKWFDCERNNVYRKYMEEDTAAVLRKLFGRLYVLRNQLMHGGATWGGKVNRRQVGDGAAIMGALVPHFVDLMMDHPDEDWGEPPYPVDVDARRRSGAF